MTSTSSSDRTKAFANILTFNGINYREWANAIRAFMLFNCVWFLIEGHRSTSARQVAGMNRPTPIPPAIDVIGNINEVARWDEKNDKALGTILLYLAPNLKHLVANKYTALEAWTTLQDGYKKPGAVGAFVAFQKLFNTTLSDTSTLGSQIDSMIEAASQVNNVGIEVNVQLLSLLIINCLPKSYQQLAGTILFWCQETYTCWNQAEDHWERATSCRNARSNL